MKREHVKLKSLGAKIRPISRTSISDEIVDQIMTLIERGELKPGQRLPSERELCVRFGIGRSSLREALRCLSIIGVLHARTGEGTSVAVDSGRFLGKMLQWRMVTERHDIENVMEVRIALEGLTASSVALNSTAKDIRMLHSLLDRMRTALSDHTRFLALDVEFHLALARASGNSLALDLITMIRGHLAKTLSRTLKLPNARPLSMEEHASIVEKIEKRDAEGARKAMCAHLQAALDRYRTTGPKRPRQPRAPVRNSLFPANGKRELPVARRPGALNPAPSDRAHSD
jgi:GntR family transcriptional repressor for pyruvate dehydrogenase complex